MHFARHLSFRHESNPSLTNRAHIPRKREERHFMAGSGFKKGDNAYHKIGGPLMYVLAQNKKTGKVRCQWFTTAHELQEESFDLDCLRKKDGEASSPSLIESPKGSGGIFMAD
jgi:uncharacterized protein YodC (DUF2158 family)